MADSERRIRRYPRFRCNFPVVVTVFAEDRYKNLDAHCKDISTAGMGMLLAAELSLGDVISLAFALPESSAKWEVRAVLRHRRGYHYGVEFISLTGEQIRSIKRYVQELEPVV